MIWVALAQPSEECQDVALGHLVRCVDADLGEEQLVPDEVPSVGGQRVPGQPALNGEVIEVLPEGQGQRRRRRRRGISGACLAAHAWTLAMTPHIARSPTHVYGGTSRYGIVCQAIRSSTETVGIANASPTAS